MFIICQGVTDFSVCRRPVESSLPLMEMCRELVVFKAIISSTYTTKHRKSAYFIRCGKKGQPIFLTLLQSGLQKKISEEVAVMHQNKPSAFLSPEQCT